jgi:putative transcriptional regulator
MTITHHPGDELLLSYALGASSEPVSLLVATHLSFCATCRGSVHDMEATGGAMLSDLEPAAMNVRALQSVLSRLDDNIRDLAQPPQTSGDVPQALRAYVGTEFSKVRWTAVAPGLAHLPLLSRGGTRARLIRARPGAAVSTHSHRGEEWTLVLTGSYRDETGVYRPGDLQSTTPEIVHRPVADDGPVCINLAVTDAPLVFKDLLPSIIGKLFGF